MYVLFFQWFTIMLMHLFILLLAAWIKPSPHGLGESWETTQEGVHHLAWCLHTHTQRCLELRACNSQPSEPFIYWGLKIYRSTFNDISLCKKKKCNHKIRVQECYGGRATSCQWCHVTSHDVIGMIGGWGVSQRGGSVMESWPVWKFE